MLHHQFQNLCKKVHRDLGVKSYKTVSIKMRFADFSTLTRDITLKTPQSSLEQIEVNVIDLFDKVIDQQKALYRIQRSKKTQKEATQKDELKKNAKENFRTVSLPGKIWRSFCRYVYDYQKI